MSRLFQRRHRHDPKSVAVLPEDFSKFRSLTIKRTTLDDINTGLPAKIYDPDFDDFDDFDCEDLSIHIAEASEGYEIPNTPAPKPAYSQIVKTRSSPARETNAAHQLSDLPTPKLPLSASVSTNDSMPSPTKPGDIARFFKSALKRTTSATTPLRPSVPAPPIPVRHSVNCSLPVVGDGPVRQRSLNIKSAAAGQVEQDRPHSSASLGRLTNGYVVRCDSQQDSSHLPEIPDSTAADVSLSPQLDEFEWYHGALGRDGANARLIAAGKIDGHFLLRDSTRPKPNISYSLSIMYHGRVFHLEVRRKPETGMFALGTEKDNEEEFGSLAELIEHYKQQPLYLVSMRHSPSTEDREAVETKRVLERQSSMPVYLVGSPPKHVCV